MIPESIKPVSLMAPAADAAGRTSAYISLKNVHRCWLVVHVEQGHAATILLSPLQATAVAGTASKVFANAVPVWACQDAAADDSLEAQTAAVNFTTSAAVKSKIVVFEIDPAKLDVAGGFDCIGLSTGASNAGNITSAMAYCAMRYASADPPSVLVD